MKTGERRGVGLEWRRATATQDDGAFISNSDHG
jgi:hypothetical protein